MSEKIEQIKDHKEIVEKVLYETDFNVESENWKTYPKSRIRAEYITYTWKRLDKDNKYQDYNWEKIVITNYKLSLNDWNIEIAKKILKNRNWEPYIVDDKKELILSIDEFNDLITNIDLEIESKKN